MEFLIISGLSGAGKSNAADILEDLDFYCVDNMPAALIPRFAELCIAARSGYSRVALVTDIREHGSFDELFKALDDLKTIGIDYRILFMEASPNTIIKRFKETRRRHPLAQSGVSIEETVKREIVLLSEMRERADFVLDTTDKTLGSLKNDLFSLFFSGNARRFLSVSIISFGFKHGIPLEADLVFDVRFLPNPFYISELRDMNGLDGPVLDFLFSHSATNEFMQLLRKMMAFLLPLYVEEGKHSLTIAIGCTGGRHRSVAIAQSLCDYITDMDHDTQLINRDLDK